MKQYCTYLISYSGNKLPPFYIGSSTVCRIENGYMGSVVSREYSKIYKLELQSNRHLFKIKILTTHSSPKEAREKELYFQKSLNVVNSPMYINKAYASVNGYFGNPMHGKNNPNYGKTNKLSHNFGRKHTESTLKLMSQKQSKENNAMFGKRGKDSPNYGSKRSLETRAKMSDKAKNRKLKVITCHCGKTGSGSGMYRFHLDNCKIKTL